MVVAEEEQNSSDDIEWFKLILLTLTDGERAYLAKEMRRIISEHPEPYVS